MCVCSLFELIETIGVRHLTVDVHILDALAWELYRVGTNILIRTVVPRIPDPVTYFDVLTFEVVVRVIRERQGSDGDDQPDLALIHVFPLSAR